MAKEKKATKKIVKDPESIAPNSRSRKKPKHKSSRFRRRSNSDRRPIASWWVLLKKSIELITVNKKQIGVFVAVYGLLSLVFVRGFGRIINNEGLENSLSSIVGDDPSVGTSGFANFGLLISGSASSTSELSQIYQTILLTVSVLALIWYFRQQQAGNSITMKMAYYRGMYPLIPFLLVLLVVGLQLIPLLIGNFLFSAVITGGIAVGAIEQTLWFIFFISTIIISFYMLCRSVVALFIVTLPEMTPRVALREAKELVRHRRFSIFLKSFAVILIATTILFVVVLPIIFISPIVAEWIFFVITILMVPFITGYMFCLYRELL